MDKHFNDTTIFKEKCYHIYKKKKNNLYFSINKKGNCKAASKFWEWSPVTYVVFLYKNGQKIEEGYWNPELWHDGYYKYYNKNGSLKCEGIYIINEKAGLWKYYDENGKFLKTEYFQIDRNKFIGTEIRYPLIK